MSQSQYTVFESWPVYGPHISGVGVGGQRHCGCTFLHISPYDVSSKPRLGGGSTLIFALGPETSSNGRLHMRLGYEPTENSLSAFRANHYTIRNTTSGGVGDVTCRWAETLALSVMCLFHEYQYLQHLLVQCNTLTSWKHWRMYSDTSANEWPC